MFDNSALLILVCVETLMFCVGAITGLFVGKKYKAVTLFSALALILVSSLPLKTKILKLIKDNY